METCLTRTQLTDYEAAKLHEVAIKVYNHSFAVGAFMVRYGRPEVLAEAAELFSALLDELVADAEIRTEALGYGRIMANFKMEDTHASQSYRLCNEFEYDLFRAAIGTREGNQAKAAK